LPVPGRVALAYAWAESKFWEKASVVALWQPVMAQLAAKIGMMADLKEMLEGQLGHGL